MAFLLDTNVVSETFRPTPNSGVIAWLSGQSRSSLFLPSVGIAELYAGVQQMPAGKRQSQLQAMISAFIEDGGMSNVLGFGLEAADAYGFIVADRARIGRPIGVVNAQIAATARVAGMSVVTRNVRDFADCGIAVINPWEAASA